MVFLCQMLKRLNLEEQKPLFYLTRFIQPISKTFENKGFGGNFIEAVDFVL